MVAFVCEHARDAVCVEIRYRWSHGTSLIVRAGATHVYAIDPYPLGPDPDPDRVTIIRGMAHQVARRVPESFDLLVIDGDHAYSSVLVDLREYGSRAEAIALHDADDPGVMLAWQWWASAISKRSAVYVPGQFGALLSDARSRVA